jgi:hypothetical protein
VRIGFKWPRVGSGGWFLYDNDNDYSNQLPVSTSQRAHLHAVSSRMVHPSAHLHAVSSRTVHPSAHYHAVRSRTVHPSAHLHAVSSRMVHPSAHLHAVSSRTVHPSRFSSVNSPSTSVAYFKLRFLHLIMCSMKSDTPLTRPTFIPNSLVGC